MNFVTPETHWPVVLLGATAVGKSEAALALAREHGAAILSLDAMQVYRGADLGTGKPSAAERQEIPHGGLDLVELGARFDVADYLADAEAFLAGQEQAGRRVVIVGGTGLYFRALTRGLCLAPEAPLELRNELAQLGVPALQERLRRCDPAMLGRLDAHNPRRLARAIAVMEMTGRSLADWQAETPPPLLKHYTAFWLQRAAPDLDRRIEERIDAMLAAGWGEEVARLIEAHGSEKVYAFAAIGYRDIAAALAQGRDLTTVKRSIVQETQAYAKRQLTWFSREPTLKLVMIASPRYHPSFYSH